MADPVHNAKGAEGNFTTFTMAREGQRHAQGVMELADLIDIL